SSETCRTGDRWVHGRSRVLVRSRSAVASSGHPPWAQTGRTGIVGRGRPLCGAALPVVLHLVAELSCPGAGPARAHRSIDCRLGPEHMAGSLTAGRTGRRVGPPGRAAPRASSAGSTEAAKDVVARVGVVGPTRARGVRGVAGAQAERPVAAG